MQRNHPESIHRRILCIIRDSFEPNGQGRPGEEPEQNERLDEVADPAVHPAVVLQVLPAEDHPGLVPDLRPCVVDVDDVLVRDLVEEVEEGHLVRAEAPLAGADVLDDDGGGGQRRQHQPLPEVSAAREPPGLLATHPRRSPALGTVGCSLAARGMVGLVVRRGWEGDRKSVV